MKIDFFSQATDLRSWIPFIQANVTATKKQLKTVCTADCVNNEMSDEVAIPASTMLNVLECPDCGKVKPSLQQLNLHAFNAHGHVR